MIYNSCKAPLLGVVDVEFHGGCHRLIGGGGGGGGGGGAGWGGGGGQRRRQVSLSTSSAAVYCCVTGRGSTPCAVFFKLYCYCVAWWAFAHTPIPGVRAAAVVVRAVAAWLLLRCHAEEV